MRYYRGTEAYQLEQQASERAYVRETPLVPLEGGGLDARARRGVSAETPRVVALAVALAVMLFVMGSVSVALTSGTVALLQANTVTSSEIKEVRAANGDLRIECSLLARTERIARIATQNLGMVYANDATRLALE